MAAGNWGEGAELLVLKRLTLLLCKIEVVVDYYQHQVRKYHFLFFFSPGYDPASPR